MRTVVGRSGESYRMEGHPPRVGGMSEVWEAVSTRDSRRVALKVAKPGPRYAALLDRERITHERLVAMRPDAGRWGVTLLDHGHLPDDRPFLVLPWHPWTLRTWIAEQRPLLADVLGALAQAATAVLEFHHSGPDAGTPRLHRDLKPDNFLVSRTAERGWECRLGDLGGARADPLADEAAPSLLYTPGYAPVEQTLPLRRTPDPSIDVYALGMTMVAALTGDLPRAAREPASLTGGGRRLVGLFGLSAASPAERAEQLALSQRPLPELVFLPERILLDDDVDRIRAPFRRAAPAEADRAADALLHALARALAPDPDHRDRDPRRLVSACAKAEAVLRSADRYATIPPPSFDPTGPPGAGGGEVARAFGPLPGGTPSTPAPEPEDVAPPPLAPGPSRLLRNGTEGASMRREVSRQPAGRARPFVLAASVTAVGLAAVGLVRLVSAPTRAPAEAPMNPAVPVVVEHPPGTHALHVSLDGSPLAVRGVTGAPLLLGPGVYSVAVLDPSGAQVCEQRLQVRAVAGGTEVVGASWARVDAQQATPDSPARFTCVPAPPPCAGCLETAW